MRDDITTAAFRFGFGLPLPAKAPTTPRDMLAALSGLDRMAQAHPGPTMPPLLALMRESDSALKTSRRAEGAEAETARTTYRGLVAQIATIALSATKSTFARALDAPDGFRERLCLFWADHFTTSTSGRREAALPSVMMDEAIRPHVTGRFGDMLRAAILHPAMLIYLDQVISFGPTSRFGKRKGKGLNENLARELLELHTLGAGAAYTQADVRELAELLTGLIVAKDGFRFDPRRAEPGAETVLGIQYGGDSLEAITTALNDLATRPETAAHIALKLATHFVSDAPPPNLVDSIAAAFSGSGGDLMATYAALLNHPAAWEAAPAKARQPHEFTLAALRALGLTGAEVQAMGEGPFRRLILNPLAAMGQPWQRPVGPDGWPEDQAAWITPQGMAGRITWAMEAPGRLVIPLPRPEVVMEAALGPRAGERLRWAVPRAENIREGLGLVLASPEFNRR